MTEPSTHESLLARLAEGEDEFAWHEFHDRYGPLIRGYAARRGLQPADRDDLIQDVLLALSKSLPKFRYDPARGRLRAYLATITRRAFFKRTRQKPGVALQEVEEPEDPRGRDDEAWTDAWRDHHVRRALTRLRGEFPELTMDAFELYALQGRDVNETSELLGLSVDSVYQAKSRVLRRMTELVHAQVQDEG